MNWRRSEQLDPCYGGESRSYRGRVVAHVSRMMRVTTIVDAIVSPVLSKSTNGFERGTRGSPG